MIARWDAARPRQARSCGVVLSRAPRLSPRGVLRIGEGSCSRCPPPRNHPHRRRVQDGAGAADAAMQGPCGTLHGRDTGFQAIVRAWPSFSVPASRAFTRGDILVPGMSTCALASIAKGTIRIAWHRDATRGCRHRWQASHHRGCEGGQVGRRMLVLFGRPAFQPLPGIAARIPFLLEGCVRAFVSPPRRVPRSAARRNARAVPTRLQGGWPSRARVLHGWAGHRAALVSANA